jgi:hypothetical protein
VEVFTALALGIDNPFLDAICADTDDITAYIQFLGPSE